MTIRVFDGDRKFDPHKKIGLRLIKSITDRYGKFDYQNTAGINTSIVALNNFD